MENLVKPEVKKQEEKYLPFALPDIGEEEIARVVKCMESGWLTTGPQAKEFEQVFSGFLGGEVHTVAVSSATDGLLLALEAFGVCRGDEVITTPYTFSATAMSVVHLGAKPVFVDIDPVTMNMNPEYIEKAITKKTKAIVPVHFAGLACDMTAINEIAHKHGLKVVEDAAHALPATHNDKLIGAGTSDATVYSFYATKTITTGEGGMIATPHKEVAERCRVMRLHGISYDVFDRYTAKGSKWYYEIVAPGYKCNMSDIAAAIGIEQLKKVEKFQRIRSDISDKYLDGFKGLDLQLPATARNGDMHSWHLFVVRLGDNVPIARDEFIKIMGEKYSVGCSVHFIPLHLHPYWQEMFGFSKGDFPNAEVAYERAVSLPIYTKMLDGDIERVIAAVKEILS